MGQAGTPLCEADRRLACSFKAGRLTGDQITVELLVRLVWVYARAGCDDAAEAVRRLGEAIIAMRRLGNGPGEFDCSAPGPLAAERWIAVTRSADEADVTPARTSIEFIWRHPEIIRALEAETPDR